ncbi:MAG: GNAT family N-acetyltransferase [Algicola sp.]|nr:GNAT family N-acetyltransferase [Algicola sp.]
MKQNPFTSTSFVSVWSKHFNGSKSPKSFDFVSSVQFLKHPFLPLYINIGKNLTKGVFYRVNNSFTDFKGKTFLIYDVPEYFNVNEIINDSSSTLRLKKVFQYQGFLMDISSYKNQDEYINAQFSSKNRREFRSNQRRLEECFNIEYSFLHGAINESEFTDVFDSFYNLLNKRFAGKQVSYHHLSSEKWNYYRELVFVMLQEKKASLLIIYRDKTPIGVTLNFHSEDILFETITVFDPDYYKFSVGKTSIIKLLEWCFKNNYKISDFSKGDFDYKHKWSNLIYDFNYHILYDSKSVTSIITASLVEAFYKTKLYLRRKKVNELYRRVKFLMQGKSESSFENIPTNFEKLDSFKADSSGYKSIDYNSEPHSFLQQYVYTFAFANPEPIQNINVYKNSEKTNEYVISGSEKAQRITF